MRGDMSYEQYKLHYDLQRIWTWMSVPALLVVAVMSALDMSHKWTRPHDEPPVWVITFAVVVVVSALFIYSGATAHKGLSILKWTGFIAGGGLLAGILHDVLPWDWFTYKELGGQLMFYIFMWLGYSTCAILTVMSMPGLKGYLVDGDHDPWTKAVLEYESEQKK